MNPRRIRLALTALSTAITAVAILIFAMLAMQLGEARIEAGEERDAEAAMAELALGDYYAEDSDYRNAWLVNPDDGYVQPLGPVEVEPPLLTIASTTGADGTAQTPFEQDGSWLAVSRSVSEVDRLVIALDRSDTESDLSRLRWGVVLGTLVLLAAAAIAYWKLIGRALEPAEAAMAQQRNFIADAAHELRTPLAVIQASASQSLAREREAWEYQRSLAEIQVAAERAGHGVATLLELARLEAGQVAPRLAPLRLDLLIEEVAAGIAEDDTEIIVTADDPLIVSADHSLLRQAVANVVHNAASRAGKVEVSVIDHDPWAAVVVADDGPGFDEAVLDKVFDRFGRGDERGSSGLGMAIVKTIVDAHHGTAAARNRIEGGAEVELRLKVAG